MKVKFYNMNPVERIKDVIGHDFAKGNPNFMNGFKHKQVDGMNLLDIQIFNNNSKWDGLVEQIIHDDGKVILRVKEEVAEGHINDYLMDNIFHGFIPSDIVVDREKQVRVRAPGSKGKMVATKLVPVSVNGYYYAPYKIAEVEQDAKTGDYIFIMKPQQIS